MRKIFIAALLVSLTGCGTMTQEEYESLSTGLQRLQSTGQNMQQAGLQAQQQNEVLVTPTTPLQPPPAGWTYCRAATGNLIMCRSQ